MEFDSQPKYGGSRSRRGMCHRSRLLWKLSLLKKTQTVHANDVSLPRIGMRISPKTKKCFSSMRQVSVVKWHRYHEAIAAPDRRPTGRGTRSSTEAPDGRR